MSETLCQPLWMRAERLSMRSMSTSTAKAGILIDPLMPTGAAASRAHDAVP